MHHPTPARPTADRRARLERVVRRTVLARRRPLAALCAATAVVAAVHAARPSAAPTVEVTVAARDLVAGTVLRADDLEVRRYPADTAPVGSDPRAVGRTLAAPVRSGEPVTDVRLVAPPLVAAYPDLVAVPVRIADAEAVSLLRPGDHVDLVAADPRRATASYVAMGVPVLALPVPEDHAEAPGAALTGRLVVVAVSPSDVARIAGAAATGLLSFAMSR